MEKWSSIRSKNFLLVGDADEAQMRVVAEKLEKFREALARVLPGLKFDAAIRTNVIVFKDPAGYRPFKPKRPDGSPDDAVAGYFLGGDDVNYITLSVAGDKGDPYQTIYHEYVHFVLRTSFGDSIPPWLDEGVAQYYETLKLIDDRNIEIGGVPGNKLVLLKQNALIPFKTFLATDGIALHSQGDDPRNMFYAQSWAFIHYLMQHDGLDRVMSLPAGRDPAERLPGSDVEKLEKDLRSYLDQPSLPVKTIALERPISAASILDSSSVSEADSNAYLGDLLYHADRLAEAEPYLRRAIALDPNSSLGNMSLGLLLMRKDSFIEARKRLEIAIAHDKSNFLAYFNYAYAISRESEGADGKIDGYSGDAAARMRSALKKAIELEPRYAESYRLLAFLNYVNDWDLDEAASLLKKGLALRPANQDFEILLARIELAQEKYDDARVLAEKLAKTASEANIRADADEILKTVGQYTKARVEINERSNVRVPWMSLLFFKRSWLTSNDLSKIEIDREINNLNRALERPRADEQQIVGRINSVKCSDGVISYVVASDGRQLSFFSKGFQDLRMAVLLEGEHSFQIDCGVDFSKYLTVLAYRAAAGKRAGTKPELTSITFVPDNFKLKTPSEMANLRVVVVEDDTIRKGRNSGTVEASLPDESRPEIRLASILESMRRPQTGESRVLGTVERIDCEGESVAITALAGGKRLRLNASPKDIKLSWFSIDASQVPLTCGSEPMMPNTILTYIPEGVEGGTLKAMEFVPAGFDLPAGKN
jgi:tetratricopeptide (TPR) repeat protein